MLCEALTDCAPKEQDGLTARLRQKRAFVYVRRHVTPPQATRIAALDLDGHRFHQGRPPFLSEEGSSPRSCSASSASRTRGSPASRRPTTAQISGSLGKLLYQTDARGRAFSRLERPPTAGATVELTIDEYLQHIAERELRDAVAANRAAGGTVVIMAPKTGEILALANEPTFNPNAFRERVARASTQPRGAGHLRAGLDLQGRDGQRRDRGTRDRRRRHDRRLRRQIRFGSRVIDDTHDYGSLSFTDVMVKSSNVGAIKVGLSLGAERLGLYVRRFGFGRALSPDFPGETPGIVWDPRKLDNSALASMSMGYQVGVTPLQMVAAISSVANGGDLIQPRVVRALVRDGKRVEVTPTILGRTISKDTAVTLTGIMEQIVERGTGNARADRRATPSPAKRARHRNSSTAVTRTAITTRRLSASSRRGILWRPSSWSSIRRMRTGTTAGRLPARCFSASRRQRFGTLACRRR